MQEIGLTTLTAAITAVVSLLAGAATVVAFIRQPLVKRIGELKHDNRLHFEERGDIGKRLLVVETRMSNGIVEDLRELRKEVKELTRKVDGLVAAWKVRDA